MEKLTTLKTEEGEGVSFGVRAVGDPTPNLTWLKDGRELPLPGRAMEIRLKLTVKTIPDFYPK